ncbi:hypothetical protein CUU95_18380 [Vreelandella alkaliphila]|uniref:hypothetical protein n=1 Tax=Vreelandella alkaliphila TaxID=272774 RepID=UPI000EA068C0|nr:hypothetical protein [Halomonas alkaliphila]AYF32316.1 hypothetical protein CUU95_00060 [Halomonas alkaliphila]AYF35658.1 hypothetical protein CUU95_18380 [Halomonas alkaliphila]
MSIVDKTIQQLVRNRVHDLTDRAMNINSLGSHRATVTLTKSCIVLGVSRSSAINTYAAQLPSSDVSDRLALAELDTALNQTRVYLTGGAQ